jgi:23S rRNA (pseudouridine1915-N3)-methyltransferase
MSTPQMAKMIEEKEMQFWNVVFIIWGAYWVDFDIIKDQIDLKMSLSPMTFPHIMATLILLEQLYRCFEIRKWSWYHH